MNVNKLRGKIVEKGMNVTIVAEKMNISRSSLYRKIHKPSLLTVYDAIYLKSVLELSDEEAIDIFLN